MDDGSVRSISTTTDPFGFLRQRRNPTMSAGPVESAVVHNTPIVPSVAKENQQPSTARAGNPRNRTPLQDVLTSRTSSPSWKQQLSRPPLRPTVMMGTDTEHSTSLSMISITPPVTRTLPLASLKLSDVPSENSNGDMIDSFDRIKVTSPLQMPTSAQNYQSWDFHRDMDEEEERTDRRRRSSTRRSASMEASATPNIKHDGASQYHPHLSVLSPLSELSRSPSSPDVDRLEFHRENLPTTSHTSRRISHEDPAARGPKIIPHRDSGLTTYTEEQNPASILDVSTASTVLASPTKRLTVAQQPPTTVVSQSSASTAMTHVLHQKRLQHVAVELQQTQQELLRAQQEQKLAVEQRNVAMEECHRLRTQRELDIKVAVQQAQQDHEARLQHVHARYEQDWEEIQVTIVELEQEHLQRETELKQWHEELQKQQAAIQEQERLQEERRHQENATYQRRMVGAEQQLEQQMVLLEERATKVHMQEEEIRQEWQALQQEQMKHEASVTEFHRQKKEYEEKYASMEGAIDKLAQQHQEAEASLQQAIQQRQDYVHQSEIMKTESQNKIRSLQEEIRNDTAEVQMIQAKIFDAHNELTALKQRIRVLVEADQSSRQATAAATAKADQELTAILSQLQVAQRERNAVTEAIAHHQQEYSEMKEQMLLEEARWQKEQKLLNQQVLELETLRKTTQEEIDAMRQSANEDIVARTQLLEDQMEFANREMQQKTELLEQRQLKFDEAIRQHEMQVTQFRQNERDFQKSSNNLQQQMTEFAKLEHREQRLRIELERKVERLTNLIQIERTEHSNQLKSIDTKVKDRKEQQEQALQDWTQRFKALEVERDEKQMDVETLQQSLADRDTTIAALQQELHRLNEELSEVAAQFQQVEKREHQDLEKIRQFMERLEAQASALEEQEEQNATDRDRLDALKLEYQDRLERLKQERAAITSECKIQSQKDSLLAILNQPWRPAESNLSVSDAFSKWMHGSLLQVIGEDEEFARHQLLEIVQQVEQLQLKCQEGMRVQSETADTLDRERRAKRELQNQLRIYRENEQQLYDDIQRSSHEKQLQEQRRRRESKIFALDNNEDATVDDEDSLMHREREITHKEEMLACMEASMREKELQIAEANDRIRMMASQLRQKETDLETKEAWLSSHQKFV